MFNIHNYRISYVSAEGKISIRHFEGCDSKENLIICENNAQVIFEAIKSHERDEHGKKDYSSGNSKEQ